MTGIDASRVRAVVRKELRDYRRKRSIVVTMAVLPLLFLLEPVIAIFSSRRPHRDLSCRRGSLFPFSTSC
jgi:ABC-2 type transport system permease protein